VSREGVVRFCVARPFTHAGRAFRAGDVLAEDDPVVARIIDEQPTMFWVSRSEYGAGAPPVSRARLADDSTIHR
jgi:hypothetical protein